MKKTTINIDEELLAEAREVTGASSDTETIRLGLRELVRRAAQKRIATFLGSEKGKKQYDKPRRREPATRSLVATKATKTKRRERKSA